MSHVSACEPDVALESIFTAGVLSHWHGVAYEHVFYMERL